VSCLPAGGAGVGAAEPGPRGCRVGCEMGLAGIELTPPVFVVVVGGAAPLGPCGGCAGRLETPLMKGAPAVVGASGAGLGGMLASAGAAAGLAKTVPDLGVGVTAWTGSGRRAVSLNLLLAWPLGGACEAEDR
jgi:hypothetical protein